MIRKLFGHATIGDGLEALKTIADDTVNLSIARDVVDADTDAYLRSIDWHGHFKSDWDTAPVPMGREGICNRECFACPLQPSNGERMAIKAANFGTFDPGDTASIIKSALHKFPSDSSPLARTITSAVQGFVNATGAEKVRADLVAKYPVGSSAWHQDGNLHTRALITFLGAGTFWRPNDTVPNDDWKGNVSIDSRGSRRNGYGLFGTFMERAQQIESGHMAIFKGGLGSEHPLIHAEPTHPVTKDARAMRLLLTIDKV